MTEHRGGNQNRKGQSTNIIVFFRKKHGQETLEHIKKQAQQPERYPAIYKYVCRTGIPVRAELCYIFFCEQQRHESAKHNSAAANKNADAAASALRAQAEAEAQQILAQAQTEAANLKARTQQQCDAETEAAARKRAQTEADCKAMLARTQQEIQQRRAAFDRRASELLDGYHSTEFLPEERAK